MPKYTAAQKIRQFIQLGIYGGVGFSIIAFLKGEPKFYRNVVMPMSQLLIDAEDGHKLAILAAKKNLLFSPKISSNENELLATKVFGLNFPNPIGMAAGFDKDAEAFNGLANIGFGFVEVGSVTPKPQPGNPKPRVFRLKEDQAVINRYGFNSQGHAVVKENLKNNCENNQQFILGINLGKNKTSEDAALDYVKGVKELGTFADYLVINVSSPNTPGLRNLQAKEALETLICQVLEARNSLPVWKPVLLKIAPDLEQIDKEDIAAVIMENPKCKIDGLIVSNTTISRPSSLKSPHKNETGGLSGKPLKNLSTNTLKDMYLLTEGTIPIIGVGGISNGRDAFEKIKAGASLVQLYSAFSYQGPPVVYNVATELAELLRENGLANVQQAVGMDVDKK